MTVTCLPFGAWHGPLLWAGPVHCPQACVCHPHIKARGHTAGEGAELGLCAPPCTLLLVCTKGTTDEGSVCWACSRMTTGSVPPPWCPSLPPHHVLGRGSVTCSQAESHCAARRHHCPITAPCRTTTTLQGSWCHVSSEPKSSRGENPHGGRGELESQ